ncbi:uncharacterized protein LOC118192360 [Stegodyphus dumicola]|uniref:uncharacterized protein LOC118192360 n=1 Tax=Stegodyphus dumicola TaxID=202533 RepID=UPI0015AA8EE5|nr:uncharacterized protein LOC118192360 [Stegodyphus dumicola]
MRILIALSSRNCMSKLRPVPASAHCKQTVFVHKELRNSSHVFLRCDALKPSLSPQFQRPHQVLTRNRKPFKILVNEKEVVVSIDRPKPAFIWTREATGSNASSPSQIPSQDPHLSSTDFSASFSKPATETTTSDLSDATTRTRLGRRVRMNPKYL